MLKQCVDLQCIRMLRGNCFPTTVKEIWLVGVAESVKPFFDRCGGHLGTDLRHGGWAMEDNASNIVLVHGPPFRWLGRG